MNAPGDKPAPKGLLGWWATPPRTGMRRVLAPWVYRRPRPWARVCIVAAFVTVGLGAVTLVFGGNDSATYEWTAFWLVLAVAQSSFAWWLLVIARSTPADPEPTR